MAADIVDEPWNSMGELMNALDHIIRKQHANLGQGQLMPDVFPGLLFLQRRQTAAGGHTLVHWLKRAQLKRIPEFRLPYQNKRQQASGTGKTTLVRLILSLISPDKGRILFVDEHNNEVLANVDNRGWISYVPQGNSLFSGTIASNVRLGDPEVSDEEIVSALISAEAWDFVADLKEGIHSVIGESGVGISEGQAQRIAIARALVRKAPAVIFDEATSGLDAETERRVMENIKKSFSKKPF